MCLLRQFISECWTKAQFRALEGVPLPATVQLLSCVWFFVTPWTAACQISLSFTISQSLLKLMSFESVMPSNHLVICLLLLSIFPSITVFSNESVLYIRWPKCWSFSMSPSNEYSGLIFFRTDWFVILTLFLNWDTYLESSKIIGGMLLHPQITFQYVR